MIRKGFLTGLVLCTLLLAGGTSVGQCTDQSVQQSAKEAGAIFVGKVVSIRKGQVAGWAIGTASNTWEKIIRDVDLVTFEINKSIKPRGLKTIDVAKDAGTFVGARGTMLKNGETYLVYALRRLPAGTGVDARRWRKHYGRFPASLAREINSFNKSVTKFETALCTRTSVINSTVGPVELELLRLLHSRKGRR